MRLWTRSCTEPPATRTFPACVGEDGGQSTIEAALLLPTLLLLVALLVQPACLLYTRCVMQSAAAEACRLASTANRYVPAESMRSYVERRLEAVPAVPVFHVSSGESGGWTIEIEGDEASHTARVAISTTASPLPLIGALAGMAGVLDDRGNIVLDVEVVTVTRPAWLEGSYGDWSGLWD